MYPQPQFSQTVNPIINYMNSLNHSPSDQELLPHLYGHKWYQWAWEFFTSLNPYNFLCSGNQVSKSSTMIRKCIMLATAPDLWPDIWKRHKPTQFWYFYPSKDVCTTEFDQKWIKEFLPRGAMKDHPVYGWKEERAQYKKIYAIHFNSGITVYFHSYEQRDTVLQASSVFCVFCDEELPEEMFDELNMRMSAVDGLFHMAFTATLGLRFWYETMEVKGRGERFKGALKIQVSKWDCLTYMDGSPSFWTPEKIRREESACRTNEERLKRIEGRFVLGSDALLPSFRERGNSIKASSIEKNNSLNYAAVFVSDITGKAAIVILNVKADSSEGDVIKSHYFDDGAVSSLSIYKQFTDMSHGMTFAGCFSNHTGFIDVSRTKEPYFTEVKRPDDNAEKLINSLFFSKALRIVKSKENKELIYQIKMTRKDDDKLSNKEVLAALVLCCDNIQWNFKNMLGLFKTKTKRPEMSERMKFWTGADRPELKDKDPIDSEFESLNREIEDGEVLGFDEELYG